MTRHRCLSRPCAWGWGGTGWVTASDTVCGAGGGGYPPSSKREGIRPWDNQPACPFVPHELCDHGKHLCRVGKYRGNWPQQPQYCTRCLRGRQRA